MEEIARAIAHKHCPRCIGGTGYGPEGDSYRYHSKACDALTKEIHNALLEAYFNGCKSQVEANEAEQACELNGMDRY